MKHLSRRAFALVAAMAVWWSQAEAQPRAVRRTPVRAPELASPDLLARAADADWEDDLPHELADSPCLGMFRRTIWGFSRQALGLELLSLDVTDRGTSGSLQRHLLDEIPPGQDPAAMEWMPEAASVWLATNPAPGSPEKPRLYRAKFDVSGMPGEFREARFPEGLERVGRMRSIDGQLVVAGETGAGGRKELRLFLAPWTGSKLADWAANDPVPFDREKYDLVVFPRLALVAGGGPEAGAPGELSDARLNRAVDLNYPQVGPFRTATQPLPRPVSHLSAISSGPHAVAVADFSMLAHDDAGTSLTLLATNDIGSGTSPRWRMITMNAPARRGARLLHNVSDSQLLVLGGRTLDGAEAGTIAAFRCPDYSLQRSAEDIEEEERLRLLRVAEGQLPEYGVENIRERALKKNKYVLTFSPGEGREGEDALEALAGSGSFRMMTAEAYVNRVSAKHDDGYSAKLGVRRFPALVLHTANGKVLAIHEGSMPTLEDMFRVTAPTRDPVGTHPDTSEGPGS